MPEARYAVSRAGWPHNRFGLDTAHVALIFCQSTSLYSEQIMQSFTVLPVGVLTGLGGRQSFTVLPVGVLTGFYTDV